MGFIVEDGGKLNKVEIAESSRERVGGRAILRGNGNLLSIGEGVVAASLYVELDNSCSVCIGDGCNIGELFIYARERGTVVVGARCGFNGHVRLLVHEPGEISIGSDCLFGSEVDVTISDMHSIIRVDTGERVNPARNVSIADRVWIGQRGMVLKGATIGEGAIIGACSVVTGTIPPRSVAVGIPADVVRTGVTWRHELI